MPCPGLEHFGGKVPGPVFVPVARKQPAQADSVSGEGRPVIATNSIVVTAFSFFKASEYARRMNPSTAKYRYVYPPVPRTHAWKPGRLL